MKTYQKIIVATLSIFIFSYLVYKFLIIDFLFPVNNTLEKFISKNTIKIENIDPNNLNNSNFDQIISAIGDSKIVFLGEQDHGEAPAFLVKSKLIKILHETMGFDVIIFESDFFGLNFDPTKTDYILGNHTDYQENIYSIWSNCLECQYLFEYINKSKESESPIFVAGADTRHHGLNSNKFLVPSFINYMSSNNFFESKDEEKTIVRVLTELLEKEYNSQIDKSDKNDFLVFLERTEEKIDDSIFWHQEIRNLRGFFHNTFSNSNNERDIQMADNLLWLLKHPFKDKKVIFWGSNSHIFKNYSTINDKYAANASDQDTTNMGSEIAKVMEDDLFILGFTSFKGEGGRLYQEGYDIKKPNPNHFEALIHKLNFDYAFIDFQKGHGELDGVEEFWMKTLIHQPKYFAWHKMFDGVFYIKDSYRCEETPAL
ncbi:erythromycin esterase family protein [Cognataquiflexum rubidum]|uniref:erythromycin esterase family protein n=1 Tax=Cognataquiflexum rubidum TaxID=2922273 RepID=UPI001F141832|nr:erythromycin esterase family protein [Cognataquiflexum rubidum]MCH6234900.1 erythromycin esterase family protein [Cognataquiflexum rubidum]